MKYVYKNQTHSQLFNSIFFSLNLDDHPNKIKNRRNKILLTRIASFSSGTCEDITSDGTMSTRCFCRSLQKLFLRGQATRVARLCNSLVISDKKRQCTPVFFQSRNFANEPKGVYALNYFFYVYIFVNIDSLPSFSSNVNCIFKYD